MKPSRSNIRRVLLWGYSRSRRVRETSSRSTIPLRMQCRQEMLLVSAFLHNAERPSCILGQALACTELVIPGVFLSFNRFNAAEVDSRYFAVLSDALSFNNSHAGLNPVLRR